MEFLSAETPSHHDDAKLSGMGKVPQTGARVLLCNAHLVWPWTTIIVSVPWNEVHVYRRVGDWKVLLLWTEWWHWILMKWLGPRTQWQCYVLWRFELHVQRLLRCKSYLPSAAADTLSANRIGAKQKGADLLVIGLPESKLSLRHQSSNFRLYAPETFRGSFCWLVIPG